MRGPEITDSLFQLSFPRGPIWRPVRGVGGRHRPAGPECGAWPLLHPTQGRRRRHLRCVHATTPFSRGLAPKGGTPIIDLRPRLP